MAELIADQGRLAAGADLHLPHPGAAVRRPADPAGARRGLALPRPGLVRGEDPRVAEDPAEVQRRRRLRHPEPGRHRPLVDRAGADRELPDPHLPAQSGRPHPADRRTLRGVRAQRPAAADRRRRHAQARILLPVLAPGTACSSWAWAPSPSRPSAPRRPAISSGSTRVLAARRRSLRAGLLSRPMAWPTSPTSWPAARPPRGWRDGRAAAGPPPNRRLERACSRRRSSRASSGSPRAFRSAGSRPAAAGASSSWRWPRRGSSRCSARPCTRTCVADGAGLRARSARPCVFRRRTEPRVRSRRGRGRSGRRLARSPSSRGVPPCVASCTSSAGPVIVLATDQRRRRPAQAQMAVIDLEAIAQAEQQVSQRLTQIQRLQAQLTNQAADAAEAGDRRHRPAPADHRPGDPAFCSRRRASATAARTSPSSIQQLYPDQHAGRELRPDHQARWPTGQTNAARPCSRR